MMVDSFCSSCGSPVIFQHLLESVKKADELPEPFKDVTVSVIVPVFNEKNTLELIFKHINNVKLDKEIIFIDDYSTDGSRDVLKKLDEEHEHVRVYYQSENQGKGAALRRGFQEAKNDIIIIQDADLEYNPNEYYKLIAPILADQADVVYGSRFIGETHRVLFFWHSVGNKFLTMLSNMFTNLNLTDMETCYKVFKREVLDGLELKQDRFGFEPEFTAKVAKRKYRIYETPIQYYGRDYDEGKKIGWRDGVKAIYCILKYNIWR